MNITNYSPTGAVKYQFCESFTVKYYIWSQPPFGVPTIGYYIVEKDYVTYLTNKHGDTLYEVTGLDPYQVLNRIEERSYYNWRQYSLTPPKTRGSGTPRTFLTNSWGEECIKECGGSILVYLTKLHPKRTYNECLSVMKNEGYNIVDGFVVKQ